MADNMFLSKSELLGWLNSTLRLKVEKVEEVGGPAGQTNPFISLQFSTNSSVSPPCRLAMVPWPAN